MKTMIKVKIQTYQITCMAGVLYTEPESRELVGDIRNAIRNTARRCIHEWETQEGRVRQEHEVRTIL